MDHGLDGVEFDFHLVLSVMLVGLDEGAADVSALDESHGDGYCSGGSESGCLLQGFLNGGSGKALLLLSSVRGFNCQKTV